MAVRFRDMTYRERKLVRRLQRDPMYQPYEQKTVDLAKVYAYMQQQGGYVQVRIAERK